MAPITIGLKAAHARAFQIAILTSRYHSLVLNVRERLKSCQTAVLLHAEVTADSEELREWMESAEERLRAHTPPQFSRIEVRLSCHSFFNKNFTGKSKSLI